MSIDESKIEENPDNMWYGQRKSALYWRKKGMTDWDIFEKFRMEGKIPADSKNKFPNPAIANIKGDEIPPNIMLAAKCCAYFSKEFKLQIQFKDMVQALRSLTPQADGPSKQEKDELSPSQLETLITSAKAHKPNPANSKN